MAEATKRPWIKEDYATIIDGSGNRVLTVPIFRGFHETCAITDLVLQSVNERETLLAERAELIAVMRKVSELCSYNPAVNALIAEVVEVLKKADNSKVGAL